MGMMGCFPGRRLVPLAGSGDQRYKAHVTWISFWVTGPSAKLRARRLDAPALSLTARTSAAALRDHLVCAGLRFGAALGGYARTLLSKDPLQETALESLRESATTNRCKPNLATERLVIRTCYPETRLSERLRLGCVRPPPSAGCYADPSDLTNLCWWKSRGWSDKRPCCRSAGRGWPPSRTRAELRLSSSGLFVMYRSHPGIRDTILSPGRTSWQARCRDQVGGGESWRL